MATKIVERTVNLSDIELEKEILSLVEFQDHLLINRIQQVLTEKRVHVGADELQVILLGMYQQKKIGMFPGIHVDSTGQKSVEGYIDNKPERFFKK